jgi:hypothetical protein
MILLDRGVDLVTPLVLPLTYEALVDHIIGIDTGACAHTRANTQHVKLAHCLTRWVQLGALGTSAHIL